MKSYDFNSSSGSQRVYLEEPTIKKYCDLNLSFENGKWIGVINYGTIGTKCSNPIFVEKSTKQEVIDEIHKLEKFVLDYDFNIKYVIQEGQVIYKK